MYQQEAPYELIESHDLSKEDIEKIHLAEDMLQILEFRKNANYHE